MRVIKRKDAGRYERSRALTVSERNGCYSVSIAAGTRLRWHFKLHDGRLHYVVKVDCPMC
jgi:hypothetical protein